jgi:hypothetical protein
MQMVRNQNACSFNTYPRGDPQSLKVRFFSLILLAIGLSYFAQKQTDRFTFSKISTLLLEEKKAEFDSSLLSQPFSYLGKGGQSYVFVSQDKKFVLKCFRSSRLKVLRFLSPISSSYNQKKQKMEEELKKTLESYALAYAKIPEETGLVAIHLDDHSSISSSLKIIDKLGICHTMDPNLIPFVIQKKALLVKEKIALDPNGAYRYLASLFSLLKTRIEKGIEDGDPNLAKNFGFVGEKAVQIDCGRFFLSQEPSNDRIGKSKEDFQHWINAHFPELSEDLHTLYEEFCHEAF